MERIQAAIEKARAGRREGPGQTADASASDQTAGAAIGTDPDAVAARWDALPAYKPNRPRLSRNRIVALDGGREAATFDVLRTKTLQQMRANGWKRLAITSPTPGCGKSTIALNLAFGLARQPELRIVLAELDLRRPSMNRLLGIEGAGSFDEVISGRVAFKDAAVRHGFNLALAPCSGPVGNPAELLHGTAVATALSAIETGFQPDLMIFDMPPMLVADDAMAFIGQVDCVLIVAAAETTSIREIDVCERDIAAQTSVMGVILNKCQYMGPDYGYSYYG